MATGAQLMTADAHGEADNPNKRNAPFSARQTVKVVRYFAHDAKKAAVMSGLSLERYATKVLEQCCELAEEEIRKKGALAVRARAESVDMTGVAMGTLNTTPEVATRLAMLAGQCLTSVARLIQPYLARLIPSTQVPPPFKPPALATPEGGPAVEELLNFMLKSLATTGLDTIAVEGRALERYGAMDGDVLVINAKADIQPGDTIVTVAQGKPSLRVVAPVGSPRQKGGRGSPPFQSLDTARYSKVGKLVATLRLSSPPAAK